MLANARDSGNSAWKKTFQEVSNQNGLNDMRDRIVVWKSHILVEFKYAPWKSTIMAFIPFTIFHQQNSDKRIKAKRKEPF